MPRCRAIAIVVATTLGVLLAEPHHETLFAQFRDPVPEFAAPLTPEQFEAGNEFLDNVGWIFFSLVEGVLIIEESDAMVEVDQAELDEAIEANFEEFRPRIKAQLLFLKKSGNLSEEQFQTVSECGEHAVKEAVRKYCVDAMQSQLRDPNTNAEVEAEVALPEFIQKTLVNFARAQVGAEQMQQYDQEQTARTAHRKRVTILNVVARLDEDLLLLPDQREQFMKLIESEWQDSWGQSLGALMPDANFIPALPDDKVLAILKDYQHAVWKTQNYNRESAGWDDDPLGLLQEDEEVGDADEWKLDDDETVKPLVIRD